jgi:hypothetical protein
MEYRTLKQVEQVAEVHTRPEGLSRAERLRRWAELLERDPRRLLDTLRQTEYQPGYVRDFIRSDNSPISVAADDPVLREEGLRNDTYGEARRFFDLSDWELHNILCYCHFGRHVSAREAAQRVRQLLPLNPARAGLFTRLCNLLTR